MLSKLVHYPLRTKMPPTSTGRRRALIRYACVGLSVCSVGVSRAGVELGSGVRERRMSVRSGAWVVGFRRRGVVVGGMREECTKRVRVGKSVLGEFVVRGYLNKL